MGSLEDGVFKRLQFSRCAGVVLSTNEIDAILVLPKGSSGAPVNFFNVPELFCRLRQGGRAMEQLFENK